MNSQWKAFLESRSATIDEEGRVRFPDAAIRGDCVLTDLSYLGLIAVAGPQAGDFLQGQLTNDVRELSEEHTQLSAYCSPKGRMLASFRVVRAGDTFYLLLPRSKVETTLQRLGMFLLRAEATLTNASDDLPIIGLSGDCAPGLLASSLELTPAVDNGMTRNGDLVIIRIPGPLPRFQIFGPPEPLGRLWDELAEAAKPVDADRWALLDIRAGLPTVLPETTDVFVPQMANLQLIDGVSFTKGCYTGQEVVARMQYLGKLKRRLYVGAVTSDTPPRPGDDLYADNDEEHAAGKVVDARPAGAGRYELMAVAEIEVAERQPLRLGPNGPAFSLVAPPYGFPAEV